MKQKGGIGILLLTAVLILNGCGQGRPETRADVTTTASQTSNAVQTTLSAPSKEEKADAVTLTITSDINGTDKSKYAMWAEDPISRHIMNLTGVRLVVERDKVNLNSRIAANDFSDLMFVTDKESVQTLSTDMYSCDMIELAREYCPEFLDELDTMEQLANMAPDGHVYTLVRGATNRKALEDPNTALTAPRYLLIDQRALGQLGEDMPSSVEELESLLYLAHNRFPELNTLTADDAVILPVAEWMGIERDV